ncbi:MAG: histidine kinase [Chitinophagaceae bacterium]
MKIRWRDHELIFITVLVISQVCVYLMELYDASRGMIQIDYAKGFRDNGFPFTYWKQVFLPQMGAVLLLFGAYLCINLLIIPQIRRISFKDVERFITGKILMALALILATGFLLAFGMNLMSLIAKPFLFNYGGHRFLSIFGYNDQPMTNIFYGSTRAIALVLILTAVAGLREIFCWLIRRPSGKSDFRVMVTNNITPLIFLYLLVMILVNPLHDEFLLYLGCVTPVFLVYIFTTFWIFPFKGDASFFFRSVLLRLLLATFSLSLFAVLFFQGDDPLFFFFVYWAFLLFAVTPLSWLLYIQRSKQILQLKGMEAALAKSDADLQLLRAQINPHFLFNALNTLYATALQRDSERTAEGIQQLGDMMRFMLEDNAREFIPVDKEIGYLRNYIGLQKLRIVSIPSIEVEDNLEDVRSDQLIAPMLLIPFVENAFKHGISLKEKSWIFIRMEYTASMICFEVRNSNHPRADQQGGRTGIGLQNVKARLGLIYPQRHSLIIEQNKEEFSVKLTIHLNSNTSN